MTMEDVWSTSDEPVPITPSKAMLARDERVQREREAAALADEWLPKIRKAAAARDRAGETYGRRLAAVRTLIKEANDAGVPMTEVAVAANVARARAHRLYKKAGRPVSQGDLVQD